MNDLILCPVWQFKIRFPLIFNEKHLNRKCVSKHRKKSCTKSQIIIIVIYYLLVYSCLIRKLHFPAKIILRSFGNFAIKILLTVKLTYYTTNYKTTNKLPISSSLLVIYVKYRIMKIWL